MLRNCHGLTDTKAFGGLRAAAWQEYKLCQIVPTKSKLHENSTNDKMKSKEFKLDI